MPVEITTVADRPELANADIDVHGWPEFMRHNRVSEAYFAQIPSTFPETCLIATVGDRVVADAHAVQFARRSDFPARRMGTGGRPGLHRRTPRRRS